MGQKYASGTLLGSTSALYICCGFIPEKVLLRNMTTEHFKAEWHINMRSVLAFSEGVAEQGVSDTDFDKGDLAHGEGVLPYRGGAYQSTASATYKVLDPDPDKRNNGSGATIDTWTLGSSANRTGNWNDVADVTGSTTSAAVGIGSRINIDGNWYSVEAITGNGESANEVTLNEAVTSGTIYYLGGIYDYVGIAAGKTTPAGFYIADTTYILTGASDILMFEAWAF